MKMIIALYLLTVLNITFANDTQINLNDTNREQFKQAKDLFSQGKYQGAVDNLNQIPKHDLKGEVEGLVHYWKGVCYNRLQDYSAAVKEFRKSLKVSYTPKDIHYEYGQALFALDRLEGAADQFKLSVKNDFKVAVSQYYLGFIAKEKGNNRSAFYEFRKIHKSGDVEAKNVIQAAEMQIADMYLQQSEKKKDPIKNVRDHVIPQYKAAYDVDPHSSLAIQINEKVKELQRKYDLVLLRLENGRPAQDPRYFLKINGEFGLDSNVTFLPAEATVENSHKESTYLKTDFIGRYTFYPTNYVSLAPEFRFNRTYYTNRVPDIYKNDNYLIAPSLRTAYEHSAFSAPAAVLFDFTYSEVQRDVNAKKDLEFSSRSYTYMLGERFTLIANSESIVRVRYMDYTSYIKSLNFKTTSAVIEHIHSFEPFTLVSILNYDMRRGDTDTLDTNTIGIRGDVILNRIRNWFTPSFGLGISRIDPINDRLSRGQETMWNPNIRLSKTFWQRWRTNLKYDYTKYKSGNKTSFDYNKSVYSWDLEYIF